MLPFVHIFGKPLATYGLLALVGILIAGVLAWLLTRHTFKTAREMLDKSLVPKKPVSAETMLIATPFAMIGFLVGAHLLYALTNIPGFIKLFSNYDLYITGDTAAKRFLHLCEHIGSLCGGLVFYGGLFGAMLGGVIYLKHDRTKPDWRAYLDVCAPAIPLFHVFGRIGCFASGCCYGIECDSFGFTTSNAAVESCNGVKRFPVQLLEASLNLILFAVLLVLFLKFWKKWREGSFIRLYLILYAVIRFSDEFLRGDTYRGIYFGLSTSQWISLAVLLAMGLTFLLRRKPAEWGMPAQSMEFVSEDAEQ